MHISTRIGMVLWVTCLCGAPAGFANETRIPSPGQSANGDRLLAWAHRALDMKSLTRKAVEESLGLRLLFDTVNEIDHSGVDTDGSPDVGLRGLISSIVSISACATAAIARSSPSSQP